MFFLAIISLLFIPIMKSGSSLAACPACAPFCFIPFNPACIACIASVCVFGPVLTACFDPDTKISKYEKGQIIDVYINEIKKNDIVLANNLNKYTRVVRNIKSEGIFNYTQITLESGEILTVTNEHGIIILDHKFNKRIIKAEKLKEEQILITMKGPEKIKNIKKLSIKDKYILETLDGTVIANNIYVSTICDDMIDEKRNADDLLKEWTHKHEKLYNEIINNSK